MTATKPLPTTQPLPLSPMDHLQPGAKAPPKGAFGAKMQSLLSPEVADRHGRHTLQSADKTVAPLGALDRMPGVRVKGGVRPAAPITAADSVPGSRVYGKDQNVEAQAQKLVSQTFFGTLLKQMHDSPFKSEMFSGGRGAKAFEPLMDQHMADHMARGAGKKLVQSIAKHLKNRAAKAYAEQKKKPGAEENPYDYLTGPGGDQGDASARQQSGRQPQRDVAPNPYSNVRGHVPTGVRG